MGCWILRLPAPRQAFRIREKGGSMAAEKAERLDFLTRMRIRELVLMGLITVTAVLANLPHEYVEETLGVSHATLIAVLACAVLLGLFLYLKFFLFVAVVLLVAGANLPEQIATDSTCPRSRSSSRSSRWWEWAS